MIERNVLLNQDFEIDVSNVIRWHKWEEEWEEKRFKTDAWQQFFTETKNVWNDLPDMVML